MDTEPVLANLHVIAPDGSERVVAITQTPFCIGNTTHNDLALTDDLVARHHACLRLEGGQILLVDLGSESGTWIGTTRLEPNQPRELGYHESFRIGPYQLRLEPSLRSSDEEDVVHLSSVAPGPAEVHGAAGSGELPIQPLIESGPGGALGVLLKTPEVTVTPGSSTNVSFVVINQNHGADRFRITVSGIPDPWLAAPPPLVELPSDARQEVNLTINPPRSPDSQAGRYRLLIQVASQNVPTEVVEVRAALTVAPYSAFGSALHPPRTGANDAAQVVVRNDGNAPQTFTVTWLDSEERYEFRPAETQMTLAAGETAAVEFRAVPRRRRWFGGPRIDVYSVKVTAQDGQTRSHTGQIVNTGLLPAWAPTVVLLLVLCSLGIGVGAFALLGPAPAVTPTTTTTVTPTVTVTGTAAGVDSDGDGLTDEEEARLGTDPHSSDTDRDGLSDYEETRRGTNPLLGDTDGDTLLDGQEAFGCTDPRNPDTDGDGVRDNVDPDPCHLPTPTAIPSLVPTNTPVPTWTPPPTWTPLPTYTPPPTNTPLPTNTPTNTPLPPTSAPPTPTPIITDWRGEYYGNTDLQGTPLVVRNDRDINFNWGRGSPDPAVPADNFAVRWTRTLDFEGRAYRFSIRADDGVRVFVDNNLIINEWHPATPLTYTADVNLAAGPHAIRVEYYDGVFDAYVLFTFAPVP